MTIETERIDKTTVKLTLNGRLDTANAPLLERKIKQWGEDITELILDFSQLNYISSMGLRVLLHARKTIKAEGRKLVIINMREAVRDVFEITGFLNLMIQEEKFVVVRRDEPGLITLSLNGDMKNDSVQDVAKELSLIKEQKTHIPITKELVMSGELADVLEHGTVTNTPVTVILDMEKLTHISPAAIKYLSRIIGETVWEARKLYIRNVPQDLLRTIEGSELGDFLE